MLHNQRVHVLEELGQLHHLLLNLDESGVSVLDGTQGGAGAALAIALHQGLAEDLASGSVLDGGANFVLSGIGAHDAVLAGHLVLGALAELRLDLLVLGDGGLETAVDAADLGLVLGAVGLGVGLDHAHALRQAAVEGHCVSGEVVELAVGLAR